MADFDAPVLMPLPLAELLQLLNYQVIGQRQLPVVMLLGSFLRKILLDMIALTLLLVLHTMNFLAVPLMLRGPACLFILQ